ncbi:MAG: polyhydroxyalkanoate granule-associated phasin [Pseudomonadota bacterium]
MPTGKAGHNTYGVAALWWKNAIKIWEIAMAAPQVIANRTSRMTVAGSNPSARDRKELTRMSQEKIDAFGESLNAMAIPMFKINQEIALIAMRQWGKMWAAPALVTGTSPASIKRAHKALVRSLTTPAMNKRVDSLVSTAVEKGLAPVHRRVTANAKRLGKR